MTDVLRKDSKDVCDVSVRNQLKKYRLHLDGSKTVLGRLSREKFQSTPPLVLKTMGILCIIFYVLDTLYSAEISFISTFLFTITTFLYICQCNYYIFIQALQSFIVWYKLINIAIAVVARMALFNFYCNYNEFKGVWVGFLGFRAILLFANNIMGVLLISVLDGFPDTKSIVKHIAIAAGIGILVWYWYSMYMDEHDFNHQKSLKITLGENTYRFYLRSIALSSYANTIFFILAHLCNSLRHPKRLHVIPLLANLEYVNFNIVDVPASDSASPVSPVPPASPTPPNDINNDRDAIEVVYHSDDVDKTDVHASQRSQEQTPHAPTKVTHVHKDSETSVSPMQVEELGVQHIQQQRTFEYVVNLSCPNICLCIWQRKNSISDTNDLIILDPLAGEAMLNDFNVRLVNKGSMLYLLLRKVFWVSELDALAKSVKLNTKKLNHVWVYSGLLASILRVPCIYYLRPASVAAADVFVALFDCVMLVCCVALFLNMNDALIRFKAKSFPLYWKLYSALHMYIALYYLQFLLDDPKFFFFDAIVIPIVVMFIVLFASLSQGFVHWSQTEKIGGAVVVIVFMVAQAVAHFLQQENEYEVEMLFNKSLSLRAVVVSKSWDLAVWFVYQIWVVWKYSEKLYVTSKVEIQWIGLDMDDKVKHSLSCAKCK